MANEIINRVAQSTLITIDLEEFYPAGERMIFDISNWLYEGLILKEKDFRAEVDAHDWSQYKNAYIALSCKTEAILPSWTYLLLSTKLNPFVKKVVVGDLALLETVIFQEIIDNLAMEDYKNKPIIIKGCSSKPIPNTALVLLVERLQPIAKSLMFGEACSTVPIYKKK